MFERTSDAIRYLCETTYHICQSGVMSTTLQRNTCEDRTVHMSFWCDANHITILPVKKQSKCYSGVMPPTLQQYLWRYNPHVTQVWCHPHYNNTCEEQPTCHSGVMPPTLQQYMWRTTHMTLWCDATHTTTIPVKKQSTCQSGVMPPTLQQYLWRTTHMSLWCDDAHTTTIPVKKQPTWVVDSWGCITRVSNKRASGHHPLHPFTLPPTPLHPFTLPPTPLSPPLPYAPTPYPPPHHPNTYTPTKPPPQSLSLQPYLLSWYQGPTLPTLSEWTRLPYDTISPYQSHHTLSLQPYLLSWY